MNFGAELNRAKWICAPEAFASPVIKRSVRLRAGAAGSIALSALGFFVLFVNGRRVGEEYYLPANSLFHARDFADILYPIRDRFTYRCYYSVYDLTPYLSEGDNTLEIALGDGWYRQKQRIAEGNMSFGEQLGAIYALHVTDETGENVICSDGSEVCRNSAIVSSQLFCGEVYDATVAARADYTYAPVQVLELPETKLTRQDSVPDRVVRRIVPKLVTSNGDSRIYDAGENISGFVSLATQAQWGSQVRIRFAENMTDGQLDFKSVGSSYKNADGSQQIMEDRYIGDGEYHIFEPLFVWHVFRYFEVIGDGEPISVAVVHSDTPVKASFESGSAELNWLFEAFVRTQLNNMHAGVPSDCPHRERLGYTGDGQICAPAAMTVLDGRAFYRKWIRDIFDSQDIQSGHVNHTAPFAGGGGGPGGWGCAAILVPYYYYQHYGDASLLAEYYPAMRRWVDYLVSHCEDGLLVKEEPGGWCLGDWCTLDKTQIPEALVNTSYYIRSLRCMEEIATVLGKTEDVAQFEQLRNEAMAGMTGTYFDEVSGSFAQGIQGADAFALYAGLGDDRTFQNLVDRYRTMGRFDTGFLGTYILCLLLMEGGAEDVAYRLLTSHELGSFGYMMDRGATTIWESWRGGCSHNHPMFGACTHVLFACVLGIRQKESSSAFRELLIAPKTPRELPWAKGSVELPCGKVSVSWKRQDRTVEFEITLPQGVSCTFQYSGKTRLLHGGTTIFTERELL